MDDLTQERLDARQARDNAILLGDAAAAAVRSLNKDDPKTRPVRLALLAALKQAGYQDLPPA